MAVDDVPLDIFSQLQGTVNQAHTQQEHNDAGDPTISVRGGQQIQLVPNEFGLDTTVIKTFVESKAKEYIDNIIRTQGVNDLHGYEPVLISAWTIKQGPGDYQALHSHEAHLSGNIYIDVPHLDNDSKPSDANIEFRLPVIKNPAHLIFTDQWRYKPQVAKMVVFPSYVSHTVYPWQGEGHRTILAWDVRLMSKTSE